MIEADFVLMLSEYSNRSWVLQTWFVSVSMALFTVAYLVGKKLNIGQVSFILLTYILYTVAILRNLTRILNNIAGAVSSLHDLEKQDVNLSPLTMQLFDSYNADLEITLGTTFEFLILEIGFFLLMFFGSIGYLIYQYRNGRKASLQ